MRVHLVVRSLVFGGLLLLAGAGCGSDHGYGRYIPPEQTSRQALEAALTAWQNGKQPGQVADGPPAVEVVDSRWKAGQKLRKFQIVGEEPGDGPKFFKVRLTLKGQAKEQEVRYVVVGRDPLWVYREDDFQTSSGM
jgi:hypothetical protein